MALRLSQLALPMQQLQSTLSSRIITRHLHHAAASSALLPHATQQQQQQQHSATATGISRVNKSALSTSSMRLQAMRPASSSTSSRLPSNVDFNDSEQLAKFLADASNDVVSIPALTFALSALSADTFLEFKELKSNAGMNPDVQRVGQAIVSALERNPSLIPLFTQISSQDFHLVAARERFTNQLNTPGTMLYNLTHDSSIEPEPEQISLTVMNMDGEKVQIKGDVGATLLNSLKKDQTISDLIPALCGGGGASADVEYGAGASCRSCHVYIDPATLKHVPSPNHLEKNIIKWIDTATEHTRLSCEIVLTPDMNGMTVVVPEYTRGDLAG